MENIRTEDGKHMKRGNQENKVLVTKSSGYTRSWLITRVVIS